MTMCRKICYQGKDAGKRLYAYFVKLNITKIKESKSIIDRKLR